MLKDDKGRDYRGVIEAKHKKEAQSKLDSMGYYLVSLKQESPFRIPFLSRKIPPTDIIVFTRQFATMIKAGIPIAKALMASAEQTDNNSFRWIINDVRSGIEKGSSLSDAMAKHGSVFSEFFISLIRIGETGGNLDQMLMRISQYLEREEDLARKLKAAFAYPLIVTIVATVVVIYLVMFVVPVFVGVYRSVRVELPIPTIVLMVISNVVKQFWLYMLIAALGFFVGVGRLQRTRRGRKLIDTTKLSLPLFGRLNTYVAVSRFIRSFGSLIHSGIPITRALHTAKSITANRTIDAVIDHIRVAVSRGDNIAGTLRASKIFSPVVVQLVAAGEQSGALDDMLDKSADFLDDEIDKTIKSLMVKLEPALTIVLAAIVSFIALAIYLPMFDLIRQISR
jgi:type IV pilus assembly protein PilC